jgi:hypothetical protein
LAYSLVVILTVLIPLDNDIRHNPLTSWFRKPVTKRKLFGAKKKALLDVAAYSYHNRERMRYHEYLAQGRPIASGPVEGACKNLI